MWLPKNERKTLAFYYREWAAGSSSFPCKKPMDEKVDHHLRDLGLIKTDILSTGEIRVSLTSERMRLGQKYNSWWSRSNLWDAEYIKNHWIWLIISYIAGIISMLLVNWLSSLFTKSLGTK